MPSSRETSAIVRPGIDHPVGGFDLVLGRKRPARAGHEDILPAEPSVPLSRCPPSGVNLTTQEQLRIAIVTWIEKTYHRKRRQRRLGKLTPIEFETINQATSAA